MRRRWERNHYDEITTKYPKASPALSTLKNMNQLEYAIVMLEQFLFLSIAVVLGIYADPTPMYGLFWGFGIHLVIHIIHTIILRLYFPGVITAVLLLPYFAFGAHDLVTQLGVVDNVIMALVGFSVIALNLLLMYWLMKKFSDL